MTTASSTLPASPAIFVAPVIIQIQILSYVIAPVTVSALVVLAPVSVATLTVMAVVVPVAQVLILLPLVATVPLVASVVAHVIWVDM